MVQLIVCLALLLLLGIEFGVFGVAFCRLSRLEMKTYETGLLGFYVYFGLFQIAALPLILLQRPFHELVILWLVIVAAVNIFVVLRGRKEIGSLFRRSFAGLWRNRGILLAAVLLLILFCCWFHGTRQLVGWDTAYYVGTVDTTVYTDSMYRYNGASGVMEKALNFRYALSSFYMHSALLCRLAGIKGMLVQKYVLGTLCVLLHGIILFAIGKRLFDEEKKALFMTGLMFVLHLGFYTNFTASNFLLFRSYEAKGFCANVVIPSVFYAIVCLWREKNSRERWLFMFLICFASVPVSMSSIVIIPAMVVIAVLAECLAGGKWHILWRTLLCVVPNGIYLLVYFLYTSGFRIAVRQ